MANRCCCATCFLTGKRHSLQFRNAGGWQCFSISDSAPPQQPVAQHMPLVSSLVADVDSLNMLHFMLNPVDSNDV